MPAAQNSFRPGGGVALLLLRNFSPLSLNDIQQLWGKLLIAHPLYLGRVNGKLRGLLHSLTGNDRGYLKARKQRFPVRVQVIANGGIQRRKVGLHIVPNADQIAE